jgi:hypothetical protein
MRMRYGRLGLVLVVAAVLCAPAPARARSVDSQEEWPKLGERVERRLESLRLYKTDDKPLAEWSVLGRSLAGTFFYGHRADAVRRSGHRASVTVTRPKWDPVRDGAGRQFRRSGTYDFHYRVHEVRIQLERIQDRKTADQLLEKYKSDFRRSLGKPESAVLNRLEGGQLISERVQYTHRPVAKPKVYGGLPGGMLVVETEGKVTRVAGRAGTYSLQEVEDDPPPQYVVAYVDVDGQRSVVVRATGMSRPDNGLAPEVPVPDEALVDRIMSAIAAEFSGQEPAEPRVAEDDRIPPEQVDRYLDFLAAQLEFAAKNVEMGGLAPFGPRLRGGERLTLRAAAESGEAVWGQAHGLIRAHYLQHQRGGKLLALTDPQKERVKALGHWAHWLTALGRCPPTISYWSGMERARPCRSPVGPTWPLFGPISGRVPTPPQLVGEDTRPLTAWSSLTAIDVEEYGKAFLKTLAQGADIYYTRGLLWASYVMLSDGDIGPVAFLAVAHTPWVGPFLTAAVVTFAEYGEFERLTWDQHVANLTSLANLGLSAYVRINPLAARARVSLGVDDAGGSPAFAAAAREFGGKAYREGPRVSRTANGRTVTLAEVEYAVTGQLGSRTVPPGEFHRQRRVFQVVDTADGPRYFQWDAQAGRAGDPVFFLGQKGYHTWSHLTELKSGHPTGFRSLTDVFQGDAARRAELQAIEGLMRDPRQSLDVANRRYIEFTNNLIGGSGPGSYEVVPGFYRYGSSPPEANLFVQVPGGSTVRVSIEASTGQLKNVYVANGVRMRNRIVQDPKLTPVLVDTAKIDRRLFTHPILSKYLPRREN